MKLPITVETRTGDTPAHRAASASATTRRNILLTTPEQLALLLSHERQRQDSSAGLKRIVLDELHSLVTNKRGELLSLGIARLAKLAPEAADHRAQRHRRAPRSAARLDRRAAAARRDASC